MANPDERFLRNRQVHNQSYLPPAHQAMRIALFEEYSSRAFLRRTVESYGARNSFPAALRMVEARVQRLLALCQRHGIAVPLDTPAANIVAPPQWGTACQSAVAGCLANISLYDSLFPWAESQSMADLWGQLRLESAQKLLPLFQEAQAEAWNREFLHASQGVPPEEAHMQHGLWGNFLEGTLNVLASQHQALGLFVPMARRMPAPLLLGAASGALATFLYRSHKLKTHQGGSP